MNTSITTCVRVCASSALILFATSVHAREVQVRMLDKGSSGSMVFEPAFVKISVGDVVRFRAVNRSHNAESIPGMTPAGAEPFETPVNVDAAIRFVTPGLYGYKCGPHFAMGMVGVIQVGAAADRAAFALKASKLPTLPKKTMNAALAGKL